MTEAALHATAELLASEVGLRLDTSSRARLERCLRGGAEGRGLDVPAYADVLRHDRDAMFELLDDLTVQESAFFRDVAHFEVLRDRLLPDLPRPVRIWSAGCANGQEPYSLAMLLTEAEVDFEIMATDVSRAAVRRTTDGRYTDREVAGLDGLRRRRHLLRVDGGWEVRPELRASVRVQHHNMVTSPPPIPARSASVIFCRNVLIYFRRQDSLRVLSRFAEWLPPGGHLFVGASEALWQPPEELEPVRWGNAFSYRVRASKPAPSPQVAAAPPRGPAPRPTPRPPKAPATPMPDVAGLLRQGEHALEHGELGAAVSSFRKASYLEPDLPIAHFHLGLALESSGQERAARRAYAAARAALARVPAEELARVLEGFDIAELARVLDDKLERL